ncbi:hypothetical protein JCM8547_006415 [Rhodosporidiobolus lusitaniae]
MERPTLSLSLGRRPSLLQTATLNAASGNSSAPNSPLTASSPITPLNSSSEYFTNGPLQTPPLTSGGLFPPSAFGFPGRRGMLRRNSSLSSVSSSVAEEEDDEDEPEWTESEVEVVQRTYDSFLAKHARTEAPFAPTAPPPRFINMVARAVLRLQNAAGRVNRAPTRSTRGSRRPTFLMGSSASDAESDGGSTGSEVEMDEPAPRWKHGLRSTRWKILSLARERTSPELEATPRQSDPDATPKRRKPLARSDSMDFLPDMRNASSISRLSNMLRQPSSECVLTAPLMAPSLSLSASTPPCAPSAFSYSTVRGNRARVQRTNSLRSIAGSPSQPMKRSVSSSSPKKNLEVPNSGSNNLKRMTRIGSESSVLPAPSLSRTLSFDPKSRSATRPPLGSSSCSDPLSGFSAGAAFLATPPSSAKKPSSSDFFANLSASHSTPPPAPSFSTTLGSGSPRKSANLSLTIDAALSQQTLKRPQGGLASAFHSPVVGAYPSPSSVSPKKKKAKRAPSSPTKEKKPAFLAPPKAQDPLAAGLGLGLGFGLGGLDLEDHHLSEDDSGMELKNPFFSSSSSASNRATLGASSSFTLLDGPSPCTVSTESFSGRRDSQPPKLVLTPSLSPSSSSSSLSSFDRILSPPGGADDLPSSRPSKVIEPGTSSPLSPAFDLNALKLSSLSSSSPSHEHEISMSPGAMDLEEMGEGEAGFLNPEYVRAGREAKALRDQFGAFSWAAAQA